jgi:transposase
MRLFLHVGAYWLMWSLRNLIVPNGKGGVFDTNARTLLARQEQLSLIILPMLEAWRSMRRQAAELGRQMAATARRDQACHLLMSIPGGVRFWMRDDVPAGTWER